MLGHFLVACLLVAATVVVSFVNETSVSLWVCSTGSMQGSHAGDLFPFLSCDLANDAAKPHRPPGGPGKGFCGRPSTQPATSFIVGGSPAVQNSWPWMVALLYSFNGNLYQICGGSVINNRYIVTAAHCVTWGDAADFKILLGDHNLYEVEGTERIVNVSAKTVHKNYGDFNFANDIALLRLSKPIQMSNEVQPVCIADRDFPSGTNCVATGWGNTLGTGDSSILQQVTVPLVDDHTCGTDEYYGSLFDPKTMVCAGYEQGGKDSCQGDSGGPLVCQKGDAWYLVGITSWGYGCARPSKPGVYTRVSTYEKWIRTSQNGKPYN